MGLGKGYARGNLQQETLAEGSKVWLPDTFVPHDLGKLYPLDSHRGVLNQGELMGSSRTPPGCTPITLARMALKIQERPQENPSFLASPEKKKNEVIWDLGAHIPAGQTTGEATTLNKLQSD